MADVWDGGTTRTGVIQTELNTDHTAIRFSRIDLKPWPIDVPQALANDLINALKRGAEELERTASIIEKIDPTFAAKCRDQAAAYREAGGEAAPPATQSAPASRKL